MTKFVRDEEQERSARNSFAMLGGDGILSYHVAALDAARAEAEQLRAERDTMLRGAERRNALYEALNQQLTAAGIPDHDGDSPVTLGLKERVARLVKQRDEALRSHDVIMATAMEEKHQLTCALGAATAQVDTAKQELVQMTHAFEQASADRATADEKRLGAMVDLAAATTRVEAVEQQNAALRTSMYHVIGLFAAPLRRDNDPLLGNIYRELRAALDGPATAREEEE